MLKICSHNSNRLSCTHGRGHRSPDETGNRIDNLGSLPLRKYGSRHQTNSDKSGKKLLDRSHFFPP